MSAQTSSQSPSQGQASTTVAPLANMQVSAAAVDAIARQLRLGIRGGGCSGFSYVIEYHDGSPHVRDRVFEFTASDGSRVRVLVDPKSLLYLNGAVLDWEQTLMRQGFKFVNPNEKGGCGCGTSFSV
jgi:iron-sulfur cluster assembly protein